MPRRAAKAKRNSPGGKRYPLNMRTTFETRQALEKMAAASGRSLAQEAEYLIERAQLWERAIVEFFGGERMFLLIQNIAAAINKTGLLAGFPKDGWMDHPETFATIKDAVAKEIDGWGPNNVLFRLASEKQGQKS